MADNSWLEIAFFRGFCPKHLIKQVEMDTRSQLNLACSHSEAHRELEPQRCGALVLLS